MHTPKSLKQQQKTAAVCISGVVDMAAFAAVPTQKHNRLTKRVDFEVYTVSAQQRASVLSPARWGELEKDEI